ncbi:hypothetical protein KUV85_15000 [Nocardioides panacisoli]|uniref:acetyl-CoA hydrolase/transferase family protein n=1 Tax=Nocardioides panacisoli TaxID=627624 RepID=UPI001C639BEA|nr:acetyl-CoA hydrolase/transferase C-terminal domain-containing protein [Nocardioides panacisoli]QYJ03623.1 hypothetical protein KUV85_15000 [Nocardioides panacisoli]
MRLPPSTSAATAVRSIPPHSSAVASPGCGTPETLLTALGEAAEELDGVRLFSGLQLGSYPFLPASLAGHLPYRTWHPYGPARAALTPGAVDYVPARASAVPELLDQWQTSVALVRVSPPDSDGWCSLGPSASYVRRAVDRAGLVLAEVDPAVPRTTGDTAVHVSAIDHLVEADTPMCTFPAARRDATSDRVATHVLDLLPEGCTLQLGIGAVPEALTAFLAESDLRDVRFVGMANDAMVPLFAAGITPSTGDPRPGVLAAELMGTATLMDFADANPAVVLRSSDRSHAPRALAQVPRLVAINSAIEVDLAGQVNAELVGRRQVSGIGGSADFVEAAFGSHGGLSVVALTSTTPDGRHSRLVPHLTSDVVSLPRHTPDAVVTEYGVAWLRGRTVAERARALADVAHPNHRTALLTASADQPQEHG